ncbi:putative HC-toxin efflux carrier TOXA [Cladophialophora carrionii]|uniref:Putative HC-toxin efflux carrier TOXA n=1 Tax=Cladophialophora carrionii TaxID=86049 RepID=A0A1C1CID6_9EURO|nr:putative HC-toxin efflux carrier TOXA [Cladophialophora carrionii]
MAERLRSTELRSSHSEDASHAGSKPLTPTGPPEMDEYPPKSKVLIIVFAMMASAFLVALDRLIIATAIPVITNHFNSLSDVGWYASAYLLTMSGFQLFIGRVYTFYNPKTVYIACLGIFELGSLVCGAAPNSATLIAGRAIAGLGSSGMFSGAITIIVYLVPLQKRPAYTGMFGAIFAVASVAGPLLGGVFTDKVSWRWCFYINLPIGGAMAVVLFFVLKLPAAATERTKMTLKEQLRQLDPIGTAVFLPAIVCLLLALQWGGTTYDWSDARIIVLLILSGVLFLTFMYLQHLFQEHATVPPRILKYRAVSAGVSYAFFAGGGMMALIYFLPIWFQAIKGASAVHSGIMNLPAVLGITVASMAAGILTRKLGYFTQWMYASCVLSSIGAGLISTFTTTTAHPKWIGYQVLWGLGLGLGIQQPSVGAQVSLPRKDVATGASMMFFAQALGGSIFASVANNIFDNTLSQDLRKIPGLDAKVVTHVGATDIRSIVPPDLLEPVLMAYNDALRNAFYVVVAVTCATVFGALAMPWNNLKKVAAAQEAAAKAAREKAGSEASDSKPGSSKGADSVVQHSEERQPGSKTEAPEKMVVEV